MLAPFARVGCDAADSINLLCRWACTAITVLITCFITCSCYRRLPFLRSARSRDRLLAVLEQARQRYRFVVVGYVVMPEHIHLLISEPGVGNPSTVMQVWKQRAARALLPKMKPRDPRQNELFAELPPRRPFWQTRFCAFSVWLSASEFQPLER
jgi:putative transposase